jgi:hypothetical protein
MGYGGSLGGRPERAFRVCQTLPREQRLNSYSAIFSNWAERDPTAAAAGLLTLDQSERGEISSSVVAAWMRQDSAAALAWAKGLAEPGLGQDALKRGTRL